MSEGKDKTATSEKLKTKQTAEETIDKENSVVDKTEITITGFEFMRAQDATWFKRKVPNAGHPSDYGRPCFFRPCTWHFSNLF